MILLLTLQLFYFIFIFFLIFFLSFSFFSFYVFVFFFFFFFQAEDGIRDGTVTGVQTCALPISRHPSPRHRGEQDGPGRLERGALPRDPQRDRGLPAQARHFQGRQVCPHQDRKSVV